MNTKVLQRLARHKNINTTLIYDHSTNNDVIEYLKNQDIDYKPLTNKDRAKVLIDKLFRGEIDDVTFKAVLELLKPENEKRILKLMVMSDQSFINSSIDYKLLTKVYKDKYILE